MTARPLRVSVIGAGPMGAGIAAAFALGGAAVSIFDPDPDALAVVPYRIAVRLDSIGLDPDAAPVRFASGLGPALGGADLVVEAAPEEAELKRRLFADLDAVAPSEAILVTTTSVLPIAAIAAGTGSPERVVGVRWRNPPDPGEAVEVVEAESTGAATVARTIDILEAAGMTPVQVRGDVLGLAGNRSSPALRSGTAAGRPGR